MISNNFNIVLFILSDLFIMQETLLSMHAVIKRLLVAFKTELNKNNKKAMCKNFN